MRPVSLFAFSIGLTMLGGCVTTEAPWMTATNDEVLPKPVKQAAAVAARPKENKSESKNESKNVYRLDAGDRVRVVVAGQDGLSNSYEIDAGGAIELPTIGKIQARGLSTVQLASVIARGLKHNQSEPRVAVQIETYRPFTIRGAVANPGQYPYVNNMTTETAIAIAGGLKGSAEPSAVTITGSVPETAGRAASSLESPVQPGDTITIGEETPAASPASE